MEHLIENGHDTTTRAPLIVASKLGNREWQGKGYSANMLERACRAIGVDYAAVRAAYANELAEMRRANGDRIRNHVGRGRKAKVVILTTAERDMIGAFVRGETKAPAMPLKRFRDCLAAFMSRDYVLAPE